MLNYEASAKKNDLLAWDVGCRSGSQGILEGSLPLMPLHWGFNHFRSFNSGEWDISRTLAAQMSKQERRPWEGPMMGSKGMAFFDLRKPLKIPFACCTVHSRLQCWAFLVLSLGGACPNNTCGVTLPVGSKLVDLPCGVLMVRSNRATWLCVTRWCHLCTQIFKGEIIGYVNRSYRDAPSSKSDHWEEWIICR